MLVVKSIKSVALLHTLPQPASVPNFLFLIPLQQTKYYTSSIHQKTKKMYEKLMLPLLSKAIISPIPSQLFNLSIATGRFPHCIKTAEVMCCIFRLCLVYKAENS